MQIRIIIPFDRVEAAINAEYQELLIPQVKNDITQFLTEVDIQKETPIRIGAHKEGMRSELTIRAKVKLRRKGLTFASLLPEIEQLQFTLRVAVLTRIQLGAQWNLRSRSTISYTWLEKPSLMGGLLPIPLTTLLEPILDRQLQSVAQDIDRYIQSISVKEALEIGWKFLHEPIAWEAEDESGVEGNFSFGIIESKVGAGPIQTKGRELQMAFEIPTEMFYSSDSIEETKSIGPIPSPSNWIPPRQLRNEVEIFYSWKKIAALLTDLVIEEENSLALNLSEVSVSGGREGIKIEAYIKGKWKGWPFYGKWELEGMLGQTKRGLVWESLDISLSQKSPTLQVADTVQRGKLIDRLKTYLENWLPKASEGWATDIQQRLQYWPFDLGLNLRSLGLDWEVHDLELTKEGLWVTTVWRGDLLLEVRQWE